MTQENGLMAFAGIMILISVALTQFVHPNWMWFTVFIGFNLFQASFTGFCPAIMIMSKLGMKSKCDKAAEENS